MWPMFFDDLWVSERVYMSWCLHESFYNRVINRCHWGMIMRYDFPWNAILFQETYLDEICIQHGENMSAIGSDLGIHVTGCTWKKATIVRLSLAGYVKSVNPRVDAYGERREAWREERNEGGRGRRWAETVEREETSGSFQRRECLSTQYLLVHTAGSSVRDGGICLIC